MSYSVMGKQSELCSCLGLINRNVHIIVAMGSFLLEFMCEVGKMEFHIPTSCKKTLNFALVKYVIFLKNYQGYSSTL